MVVAPTTLAALFFGTLCAGCGQVFLKLGADGQQHFSDFINAKILIGFILYGMGAALWVYALSRAPLVVVYPFSVLTFVFVYLAAFTFLGETLSKMGILGAMTVLVGLAMIVFSGGNSD